MRLLSIAVLAGLAVASPTAARAWGDEGHRIVGLVAERLLSPTARAKLDALLAADPDTLTASDLASRTTWADRWRDSDRNTTKVRYTATREWHFVDIELDAPDLDAACFGNPPLPAGVPASAGPAHDCVVHKIEEFAAELGAPATSQPERILALKYLLHFVGDLHQPLHAADHHDQGGNAVAVLFGNRTMSSPLHAWWDTTVVERLGRDPQAIADQIVTGSENDAAEWSAGTPRDWARETFTVARDVAYALPEATETDAGGATAVRLDLDYETRATEAARQQLAKAGVRLAVVLNAALK